MTLPPPVRLRQNIRFALPPSLGVTEAKGRAERLEQFLAQALAQPVQVVVGESYQVLAKDLLAGRLDAAWAPPFVCARIEAMGVRILVRGVRRGGSTYRSALVCRADFGLTLEKLPGRSAVWVDRDSVGGYLLPIAFLRGCGIDPDRAFFSQHFAGSYRAAVESVLQGRADVTSVFAAPASASNGGGPSRGSLRDTGLEEVLPGCSGQLTIIGFTDESPNDGVAVAMGATPALVESLEQALLAMQRAPEGRKLLKDIFNAEAFESAPRMGYRALYRVAMASL